MFSIFRRSAMNNKESCHSDSAQRERQESEAVPMLPPEWDMSLEEMLATLWLRGDPCLMKSWDRSRGDCWRCIIQVRGTPSYKLEESGLTPSSAARAVLERLRRLDDSGALDPIGDL